ncbi:phosphoribosyl-AMP cyclohydrolase [Methanofollis fontis]|uniref:Phosphoribosyl-AMP cyclohydrolase n=1 Tax=Methanofollis fontis TaxID=2052832 RepID=A0A483CPB4_9EURY|nr:phosphoribosyl-AMP cyclohydrolase [Methanofollis fontis]TAJ44850.1 phosphoribosyl-AMP cyclohydrolase [Methanofollis fontis]
MDLNYTHGLIPVIVQEAETDEVLMLAWANDEALRLTRESGFAHYWSRSRQKIWKKGEESGNLQRVIEIRVDCDADTLLYRVEQRGAACHTGHHSCFYRDIEGRELTARLFDPSEVYANKG